MSLLGEVQSVKKLLFFFLLIQIREKVHWNLCQKQSEIKTTEDGIGCSGTVTKRQHMFAPKDAAACILIIPYTT